MGQPAYLRARSDSGGSRLRGALFLCGLLTAAVAGPAAAQQYPPSEGALAISTSEAAPGEPVTLSGDGFAPGSDITITFESTPVVVGTTRADATGRFTTQVRIPLDATPGMHTLRAIGVDPAGRPRVLTTAIRVAGDVAQSTAAGSPGGVTGTRSDTSSRGPKAGSASPGRGAEAARSRASRSGGVAFTGSSMTVALLAASVSLVVAGSLLVVTQRRRRRAT